MASFTTVLTGYRDNGDQVTYTVAGHTALDQYVVVQRRKDGIAANGNIESWLKVKKMTHDADGAVLPSQVEFEFRFKYPKQGQSADVDAALATILDLANSDQYANTVTTNNFIQ